MKNDDYAAGREFLNWMESRYPGSRAKILKRARVPIAAMRLSGLEPAAMGGLGPEAHGLGQFETITDIWSGTPPLPTAGGAPTWSGAATLQPAATPKPEPAWWEKIASSATDVAKGYLSYKQQDKITDMQIERMSRGYPPIEDPGRYMAPTVKIAHEIDPRQFAPSKETQNLLLIGGLAIGAVLLFTMMGRR